uniref:Uncharacterized protein n=1 Tax=Leptocylindrus danicus TaxID=163516 RepID=A0A7S2P8X6_9STRA|mmetsp:Transcript_26185/g.38993  ORF Transcript_26185/g.38993 Transcript_26185/m.38993 type:complete len:179 (+) Transcript_26185:149-685(+)
MGFKGADLEVWINTQNYLNFCNPFYRAPTTWTPPAPSDTISQPAWDQFVSRVGPKILRFDQGQKQLSIFLALFITFFLVFVFVLEGSKFVPDPFSHYFDFALCLVSVFVFSSGRKKIVDANKRIDEEIQGIVVTTNFSGYKLVYYTEHTGFVGSKHKRPTRVFLFYADNNSNEAEVLL